MLLITGPAGSGKTTFVLDRLREALSRRDFAVRLLVPTATLAQHLQNRVAREGFVFPRTLIQTLHGFVDGFAGAPPEVSETLLYLLVEEAVRRVKRPEFAAVAELPGFSASLARTVAEFAAAGCDSARLARCLPETPLGEAFLAVYREVDLELARRNLSTRAARLERAAARLAVEGTAGVHTLWLDGFHALPDPELQVVKALGARADLTVTLTEHNATRPTRDRLLAAGFRESRLAARRPTPAALLVKAPGLEREVDEMARRILEHHRSGRPFREIGIIVRAADVYVPLLRATLQRFGIPARFYFDADLQEHPAIKLVAGAVNALLADWEHEATLAVLRLDPRLKDSYALDRFAFEVRRQLPGRGLGPLKALLLPGEGDPSPSSQRLLRLIDQLGELDEWRLFTLDPHDWAQRFRCLRALVHAVRPQESAGHETTLLGRGQVAALDLFEEALDDAAAALAGRRHLGIAEFWRAVQAVLRLKPLRVNDYRRNVVHVISAHEARQWELPIVFVCGLVEKQFPQFQRQEPFFPDPARSALNQAGIRVRTASEFELEERALFDAAMTRATMQVVLTYPEFDARGERNHPSWFLEDMLLPRQDSHVVRPRPRGLSLPRRPAAIEAAPLLEYVGSRSACLGPTTLEIYLQCAFQYFGGRTLRLKGPPDWPEDRLNFMLQGSIVHRFLQEWWPHPQDVEPLFDRIFQEMCEENCVPLTYRTARLRDTILRDLLAFAADPRWPRAQFESRTEVEFVFPLDERLEIRGKIDRVDVDRNGRAYVIDYKYSGAQGTRDKLNNTNLLQPALYCLAAERVLGLSPAGMFYIGLRGGVQFAGWDGGGAPVKGEPVPEDWTRSAAARTLQAVAEIRAGRIAPQPSDADHCRFCDFIDVCRVECGATVERAEGA